MKLTLELDNREEVINVTVNNVKICVEICKQGPVPADVITEHGTNTSTIISATEFTNKASFVQAAQQLRSKPILLEDLESYIERMDSMDGFKSEFDSLPSPQTQLRHWSYAMLPDNIEKHRYKPPEDNLLAYDDTRVILTKLPGDQYSDFINANWIDNYLYQRTYIATQCPIESTIEDFYRMIWQFNIHQVVMLASPHDVEKNKCSRYFPNTTELYGGVNVELQRKEEFPDVVVRIYSLKKNGVTRVFVHHHFISWPDLGVPEDPQQILNLILKYRSSDTYTKAWPLVIHCSAGVGRTGTFLLTDAMFDMAKERKSVDFLAHLWHIRNQRVSLVEKPEQYRLAHRVILKAYQQGLFEETNKTLTALMNEKLVTALTTDSEDEIEENKAKHKTKIFIDPEMTEHEIVIRVSNNPQVRCAA